MERWNKDGAKDLIGVLKRWKPWIPPVSFFNFRMGN